MTGSSKMLHCGVKNRLTKSHPESPSKESDLSLLNSFMIMPEKRILATFDSKKTGAQATIIPGSCDWARAVTAIPPGSRLIWLRTASFGLSCATSASLLEYLRVVQMDSDWECNFVHPFTCKPRRSPCSSTLPTAPARPFRLE